MTQVRSEGGAVYNKMETGEVAVTNTSTAFASKSCGLVQFRARTANTHKVYIGSSDVTVTAADGSTDATTGLELSAGEQSPWIPISNMDKLAHVSDNASGNSVIFIAMID